MDGMSDEQLAEIKAALARVADVAAAIDDRGVYPEKEHVEAIVNAVRGGRVLLAEVARLTKVLAETDDELTQQMNHNDDTCEVVAERDRLREGITHHAARLLHLGIENDADHDAVVAVVRDLNRLRDGGPC